MPLLQFFINYGILSSKHTNNNITTKYYKYIFFSINIITHSLRLNMNQINVIYYYYSLE